MGIFVHTYTFCSVPPTPTHQLIAGWLSALTQLPFTSGELSWELDSMFKGQIQPVTGNATKYAQ